MIKLTPWLLSVLFLTSPAETPNAETKLTVIRLIQADADYPNLPLTPISPRF